MKGRHRATLETDLVALLLQRRAWQRWNLFILEPDI
jgi:hypothetical protein